MTIIVSLRIVQSCGGGQTHVGQGGWRENVLLFCFVFFAVLVWHNQLQLHDQKLWVK